MHMIRRASVPTKAIGIGLLCAIIIGYGLWQSRELIAGPVISVESPTNGGVVSDTNVTLSGQVTNVSYITLNGRQIYADTDGSISEPLLLAEGYNVIQLTGTDKFGRTERRTIELVAHEDENSDAAEIVREDTETAAN